MKTLSILVLSLLVSCIGKNTNIITGSWENSDDSLIPDYTRGCQHPLGDNYDSRYVNEDGTCVFTLCADQGFYDFDKGFYSDIGKYLNKHGLNHPKTGKSRITSTCKNKIIPGCLDPDASNLNTLATEEDKTCMFSFCSDPNFFDYDKKTHDRVKKYLNKHGNTHPLTGKHRITSTCQNQIVPGCMHKDATNFNPIASQEDQSCIFKFCSDIKYQEFDSKLSQSTKSYLNKYGLKLPNGKDRVQSTCQTGKTYCLHPEARNFTGANTNTSEYLNEYCEFEACGDSRYQSFNKFQEYLDYLKTHKGNVFGNNSMCTGLIVPACLDPQADNYNASGTIEDSSCTFSFCEDKRYEDFDQSALDHATKYFNKHGANLANGKSRINSTCAQPKLYCLHPEALNFKGSNIDITKYVDEYCYFRACTKPNFEGYAKYKEFEDYLKTHKGEIAPYNDPVSCKKEFVSKTEKLDPDFTAGKFDKATISFIIDDSGSMKNEIDHVKDALKEVTDLLIATGKDLDLKFHKMSDMNEDAKSVRDYMVLDRVRGNYEHYNVGFLNPFASIPVTPTSDPAQVKQAIFDTLDPLKTTSVYYEQGLCLTLRHMNDLAKTTLSDKEQHIVILISDEDENYKNNSVRCYEEAVFWWQTPSYRTFQAPSSSPFTDNQGNEQMIEAFLDIVNDSTQKDKIKKSYGWLGFIYDEFNSNCTNPDGAQTHGETYLDFAQQLENNDIPVATADICSDDYAPIIEEKVIKGFLDTINYKYFFSPLLDTLVVNSVSFEMNNGSIQPIAASLYTLGIENNEHFVEFDQSLKVDLQDTKKILVDFTYKK